ncbi:MAG: HAMP domain-containing histidine kinase [Desulfotalea sp.]
MQETYFATAQRSTNNQINEEIKIIAESSLIDNLMTIVGGLFAVLDENRQIVTINHAMLKMLDVDNVEDILGCRPGEAFHCIHSSGFPNGCGTTKGCRTCGAVIAIVSCLELDEPVEKICVAKVYKDGNSHNLYLGVRAAPIILSGSRFVLLFLQDLSAQQEIATLERVFFHDVNNMLTSLMGYSELLTLNCEGETLENALCVKRSANSLCREVALQRIISQGELSEFEHVEKEISVNSIVIEICNSLKHHPVGQEKTLSVFLLDQDKTIVSDQYLIEKILINMILNAFEASCEGETVKVSAEILSQEEIVFAVWNNAVIHDDVKQRLFQKNFSTKNKKGRGLGTYSMKLFGEEILKGQVYFSSEEGKGTTFNLKI